MKRKKALLPILTGALLVSLGLGACGGKPNGGSNGGGASSSEQEEVKINVTAEGDKKEIQVGESVQLHADVDGVEWSTRNTEYVSVGADGLVTAVAPGSARITAKKDGYANGTITITVVKAPAKAWQHELRLEEAEHSDPDNFWGMDLSAYGYGILGPGDSPVENNNGATDDGTSLGYLQAGCKETMKFTSDKAVRVELGVTMAYNAETALNGVITVKFNNVEIPMTSAVCEGPEDGDTNNYYDFHAVSFGMVDLIAGENVLEIEVLGQVAPNMDKAVIWTQDTLQIVSVPAPQKQTINVTNADIKIQVEETAQIQADVDGLSYESADATIASVSTTGLVTGVAAGKTTITLSKDGYKDAKVEVTVKAKPVAGQIILEAEEGTLGGSARVENDANASSGARVGYLSADTSLSLKTTLEEAGEYTVSMMAYSNNVSDWSGYPNVTADELDLSSCMTFNNDVALTGKVLPAGAWGAWVEVSFGDFNLIKGENTFDFAFTAQGPNIDYVKLVNKNGGGEVTPPVTEKVTVSFDANGATGEMASVQVDKGSEYTLPANGFTAPTGKVFAGWDLTVQINQWQSQTTTYQPNDKVTVSADTKFTAHWGYQKDTPIDLSSAYYAEAEAGELAGGAKVENNANAHGEKSVGYMSAGASVTIQFQASDAGKAKLVLLASSASANWMSQPVQYYDQDVASTTSITVNGAAVDLTGKGLNGSDAPAFTQINLGEFDVKKGNNTVVISAIAQSCNIDAIAVVSSLTISDPLPPVGLVYAEIENSTFVRADGQTDADTLTVIDQADAHGGKAVTNFKQGSKVTVRFNASAAGKVGLKLIASSSSFVNYGANYMQPQQLSQVMTMKLNENNVDLTGKSVGTQWAQVDYEWSVVDFGEIDVQLGENVIVLEATAELGPNLDALRLQGSETLTVTVL